MANWEGQATNAAPGDESKRKKEKLERGLISRVLEIFAQVMKGVFPKGRSMGGKGWQRDRNE